MARMWVKGCDGRLKRSIRRWCWVSEEAGDGKEVGEGV